MSLLMNSSAQSAPLAYTPSSDVLDRHDYGVQKNRKSASTGGGRAWSEEEVCRFAFMLQGFYNLTVRKGSVSPPDPSPEDAI